MSVLNFVTDGTVERICRDRKTREDAMREGFQQKLKLAQDHAEGATDYLRDMIRAGIDVTEELKQAEAFGRSLTLVSLLLKHHAEKRS
jgi:hypothetical protein